MKRLGALLTFVMMTATCVAQQMSYSFYEANPPDEPFSFIESDTSLFLLPLTDSKVSYGELSRYSFDFVRSSPRGLPDGWASYRIGGIDLSDAIAGRADYNILSSLNLLRTPRTFYRSGDMVAGGTAGVGETTDYSIDLSTLQSIKSVKITASDARYRFAANLSAWGVMRHGWSYALCANGRVGRDRFIDGVFTQSADVVLGLTRSAASGTLSFALLASPSLSATKGWSTLEAFCLTGDNLYNPSWGWWNGKQRSARVRRDFTPMLVARFDTSLGSSLLSLSMSLRGGERSVSGMTWFDAVSPVPDYYNKMPSGYNEQRLNDIATNNWRGGNADYTQIDWARMCSANSFSDGCATYVADRRVERPAELQFAASLMKFHTSGVTFETGVRVRLDAVRYFKRADDLLGGEYFYDYDQYLIDDELYGDRYQNDLRHADRRVKQGDEFGYNYSMFRNQASLYATVGYDYDRWHLSASGELSSVSVWRQGHYRKQSAAEDSFGRSARSRFSPYSFTLGAECGITPSMSLRASALALRSLPLADNLFMNPQFSNVAVDKPLSPECLGATMGAHYAAGALSVDVEGFAYRMAHGTHVKRYYDDMCSLFSDMTVSGVESVNAGVDVCVEIDVSRRITMSVGGTCGSFRYVTNADVNVFGDVDQGLVVADDRSYLKGYSSDSSPELAAVCKFSYRIPFSWWLNLEWAWAGGRKITASELRRTGRILSAAASPECAAELARQRSLPDASSLRLFLYRRFELSHGSCVLSLDVRNVLNDKDILYGGYEPMRVRKPSASGTAELTPMDARYSYAYPRNIKLSVAYEF